MINPKGDVAKRCTQLCTPPAEEGGPPSILGNYFNSLRQQGPSDTLDGRKLVSNPALHYPVPFNLTPHEYRSFWCLLCTANVSLEVPIIRKAGRLGRAGPDNGFLVPWAGSHHRSKVDCTGDGLRLSAVDRPPLKSSVGTAYSDTCRPGAQRAGSLHVPCQL